MADTPQAPDSALFNQLVTKFGIRGALALLPLLDPKSSTKAKAFGGASLAGSAAQVGGKLAGSEGLATLGKGVGQGLGLASGAYGAYQAATDPNLSKTQQVGHSGRAVADTLMGLLIPYYGLAKAASVVGQVLTRSGSPQVRGAGRAIDQAAEPAGAKAFWNVAQGDMSPKAALTKAGPEGLVTDMLGPLGAIFKGVGVDKKVARNIMDYGPIPGGGKLLGMLGIGSKPTQGTQFRRQVQQLFDQAPGLKGTDTSKYNIDPKFYESLTPQARQQALDFAGRLTPLASASKANPESYKIQLANILLNRFGNSGIPGLRL